jgi:hypothetical protein
MHGKSARSRHPIENLLCSVWPFSAGPRGGGLSHGSNQAPVSETETSLTQVKRDWNKESHSVKVLFFLLRFYEILKIISAPLS